MRSKTLAHASPCGQPRPVEKARPGTTWKTGSLQTRHLYRDRRLTAMIDPWTSNCQARREKGSLKFLAFLAPISRTEERKNQRIGFVDEPIEGEANLAAFTVGYSLRTNGPNQIASFQIARSIQSSSYPIRGTLIAVDSPEPLKSLLLGPLTPTPWQCLAWECKASSHV